MASSSTVHVNDIGIQFLITVRDESGVVNLSTVNTVTLFFQKPDQSIISRLCNIVNPTQGIVQYVSTSLDFDQPGKWKMQVVIKFADDNIKHSDIGVLTVEKNISN